MTQRKLILVDQDELTEMSQRSGQIIELDTERAYLRIGAKTYVAVLPVAS